MRQTQRAEGPGVALRAQLRAGLQAGRRAPAHVPVTDRRVEARCGRNLAADDPVAHVHVVAKMSGGAELAFTEELANLFGGAVFQIFGISDVVTVPSGPGKAERDAGIGAGPVAHHDRGRRGGRRDDRIDDGRKLAAGVGRGRSQRRRQGQDENALHETSPYCSLGPADHDPFEEYLAGVTGRGNAAAANFAHLVASAALPPQEFYFLFINLRVMLLAAGACRRAPGAVRTGAPRGQLRRIQPTGALQEFRVTAARRKRARQAQPKLDEHPVPAGGDHHVLGQGGIGRDHGCLHRRGRQRRRTFREVEE
jgi:hypothetical protein